MNDKPEFISLNHPQEGECFGELRKRAEKIMKGREIRGYKATDADFLQLIQECEAHQIELKLQNEALRRAQHESGESRNRFNELYDSAPVGLVALSPEKLIEQANRAARKMLSGEGAVLTGRGLAEWIYPDDHPVYFDCLKKAAAAGGRHTCELRLTGIDRNSLCVLVQVAARLDRAGNLSRWNLALSDITERRRSEEALANANNLVDTLLAQAYIGFAVLDRDLRFILVNEKLSEINGIPADAHIGKRVRDIVPSIASLAEAVVDRILATGEPVKGYEFSGETDAMPGKQRYWNESWYPMRDGSGAVTGFGVVVEEITERKRAEEELKQSEKRARRAAAELNTKTAQLEVIIDSAPLEMSLFDKDGTVILTTPAGLRLHGFADIDEFRMRIDRLAEALEARTPDGCLIEFPEWPLVRALKGETVRDFELQLHNRITGRSWTGLLHATPVFDENGEVTSAIIFNQDITRIKTAEAALRDALAADESHLAQLNALVNQMTDGLVIYSPQGDVLDANPAALAIEGFKDAAALRASLDRLTELLEVSDPEGRPLSPHEWPTHRVLRGEKVNACEVRVRRRDTGKSWIGAYSGSPIRDREGRLLLHFVLVRDVTEQRQTELALKESEDLFRKAFDLAPVGVVLTDLDGRFQRVNSAYCRITGYSEAELMQPGFDFKRLTHPDDLGKNLLEVERIVNGEAPAFFFEKRYIRKDGSTVWVQASAALRRDTAGRPIHIIGLIEDISTRKQAEAELRESERRFHRLFEDDLTGNSVCTPGGKILLCNPAFAKIFGFPSPDEAVGTNILELYFDPRERISILEALRQKGKLEGYETWRKRRDGAAVHVVENLVAHFDIGNEIFEIQGYLFDDTERKRAEEELENLNRTLHALGKTNQAIMRAEDEPHLLEAVCRIIVEDCGHPMVWIGFAQDDETKTVRPAAQAGFEEDYLETMKFTLADTELGRGPVGTAIRTGVPDVCNDFQTESRMDPWREKALKRGYAASIALPLKAGGRAFGVLAIYSRKPGAFTGDEVKLLSELAGDLAYGIVFLRLRLANQESEMQLRQLNETLEQQVAERTRLAYDRARQLRALVSELTIAEQRERRRLGGILHDNLQQFLVAAKMNASVLSEQVDDRLKEFARKIEDLIAQSIQESRSLTAELAPPALQQGGLLAALKWLVQWMQDKHGLAVALQADPGLDPQPEDINVLLFQSIRELLLNVVKHAGVKSARIEVARVGGDRLRAVVCDRGIGFDPEAAWQKSRSGAGFGLFSIRERLTLLGGRLEVESAPGKGAVFALSVPLETPAEKSEKRIEKIISEIQQAKASTAKTRVLIADDHAVFRQGLAAMLNLQVDVQVVGEAADGQEVVEKARKLQPDVILMDISMPKMSGVDATRIIHSDFPDIRIIGLSMFDKADQAEAMMAAGASTYLQKSENAGFLLEAIRGEAV